MSISARRLLMLALGILPALSFVPQALSLAIPRAVAACPWSEPEWPEPSNANEVLVDYFEQAVAGIAQQSDTRNYQTADQWLEKRGELQNQLADMLGLLPEPPRTDLKPTITGSVERDGIVVQRLHFQSMPGLYVTANLYRPANVEKPLPAILYVCGHSVQREKIDDREISYGNKTGYQRHGAWFARHGYVCLTIDTVQWGEFLGTHWGTYRQGRWDWLSTGYTPAGAEAWNGIRAIDYLQTLPEVDADRIGLTGRSGGGAYSWFIAALDQRVKAVVPVAGITDLENHVVDGCVSGHCDCMFLVNYYQWDYPTLAALIAPRPLLLANSDSDGIFPLSGVLRTADQVRHVYKILDAKDSLGLLITPGPHKDTPELQVGAFRWFDRHLKGLDVPVDEAAIERFDRKELRVFDSLPEDQRVHTADDVLITRLQQSSEVTELDRAEVLAQLRKRSLGGWPSKPEPLNAKMLWSRDTGNSALELWEFVSQGPWRLRTLLARGKNFSAKDTPIRVHLVDDIGWEQIKASATGDEHPLQTDGMTVYVAVRGIGPHAWSGSEVEKTHIERRFYLIGQTLAGMQIWDAIRGLAFAQTRVDQAAPLLELTCDKSMRGIAAYAAVLGESRSLKTDATLPSDYLQSVPLLGQGQIKGLESLFKQ